MCWGGEFSAGTLWIFQPELTYDRRKYQRSHKGLVTPIANEVCGSFPNSAGKPCPNRRWLFIAYVGWPAAKHQQGCLGTTESHIRTNKLGHIPNVSQGIV